jgi:hypothetical protein
VVRDRAPRLITESAQRAFVALPGAPELIAGAPRLVRTTAGEPSYWLVPGHAGAGVQAFARVLPDGHVAAVGATRAPADDVAAAVTGLSEARARAEHRPGQAGEPTLVHDGPIGREAWLYVTGSGDEARWVFATGGGAYERPAGEPLRGGPTTPGGL